MAPKRPLIPGYPVTLISRCFIGTEKNIHTPSPTAAISKLVRWQEPNCSFAMGPPKCAAVMLKDLPLSTTVRLPAQAGLLVKARTPVLLPEGPAEMPSRNRGNTTEKGFLEYMLCVSSAGRRNLSKRLSSLWRWGGWRSALSTSSFVRAGRHGSSAIICIGGGDGLLGPRGSFPLVDGSLRAGRDLLGPFCSVHVEGSRFVFAAPISRILKITRTC